MNPYGLVERWSLASAVSSCCSAKLTALPLQVAEKILLHLDNVYDIPNLRGRSAACRTNLPSNTAFRGFGVPQGLLVVENMINDVAMLLGRPADQVSPGISPGVVKQRWLTWFSASDPGGQHVPR